MTDQLRLGTLGDEIFGGGPLQTGGSIPIPLQGGISIPTPAAFAASDDLPLPPPPLYGDELPILYGGISIPTP